VWEQQGRGGQLEVLTAMNMKITVFWDVTLVEKYQHFRGTCNLHSKIDEKMEAPGSFETLVPFYQTIWRLIPNDNLRVHFCYREILPLSQFNPLIPQILFL
jgi:hypothetical protein